VKAGVRLLAMFLLLAARAVVSALIALPVRGRGSAIHGTGGTATGAVSLMRIINAVGEQIKAGGGRRTALMLCLDAKHGDIQEFLEAKLDLAELNNANVSVVFSEDPEEFFKRAKAQRKGTSGERSSSTRSAAANRGS
jgi:ribonucleotide reductase alpha subunit